MRCTLVVYSQKRALLVKTRQRNGEVNLVLETLIFNFYRLERLALVEQFLDSKDG